MRRIPSITGVAILAVLTGSVVGQGDAKKDIKIEQSWSGRLFGKEKEALRMLAPADGFVDSSKQFHAIWKAWRTEEKIPAVDFDKKLVLFATAPGPNQVTLMPVVDAAGNLSAKTIATLVGGPGFGYTIVVIDRDGIKTVNGKSLAKEK
jgi:hypothetical protein